MREWPLPPNLLGAAGAPDLRSRGADAGDEQAAFVDTLFRRAARRDSIQRQRGLWTFPDTAYLVPDSVYFNGDSL